MCFTIKVMTKHFSFSYSEELYNPTKLKLAVTTAVKILTPYRDEFDSIVVRGVSGTTFGGALSIRLRKPLFVVRKPSDKSHEGTNTLVTGNGQPKRWLFVDDFMCMGETFRICKKVVGVGCVGYYLYSGNYPTVVLDSWKKKKKKK